MPTTVSILPEFQRQIKRLKRRFPAVTDEVRKLLTQIEANDRPGDKVPGTAFDVYKVRLSNPSARRGKSGGFRVIYYAQSADHVFLVTIYSKTDQSDVSLERIRRVLDEIPSANS